MIFRGQLQRIHDYMFHIAVAVVIFIAGFIIAYSNLPKPQFDYTTFTTQQPQFQQCLNNAALQQRAQHFEQTYATLPLTEIQANFKALTDQVPDNCGAYHVESSYEQLQAMATPVLAAAQQYYGEQNVKAVNAVYTQPSPYRALLGKPQPYLFFISDSSQTRIAAFQATPTADLVEVVPLWDHAHSQDLAYTQGEVQKLLLVFNEIKS